ncbi:MAG: hypothetical protein CMJ46_05995 [Planctomyces sp.]|nr:hypothetical protein [Planctomyces sp.]
MQTNRITEYMQAGTLPTEDEVREYLEEMKQDVLRSAEDGEIFLENKIKQNPGLALGIGLIAGLAIGWLIKR